MSDEYERGLHAGFLQGYIWAELAGCEATETPPGEEPRHIQFEAEIEWLNFTDGVRAS